MTNEPPECSTCGSDYNLPDPGEPYESGNCDKCEIEMLCADLRKSDLQIDEAKKAIATVQGDPDETPLSDRVVRLVERFRKALMEEGKIEKRNREGDGHICIAADGVPCSICGRAATRI